MPKSKIFTGYGGEEYTGEDAEALCHAIGNSLPMSEARPEKRLGHATSTDNPGARALKALGQESGIPGEDQV